MALQEKSFTESSLVRLQTTQFPTLFRSFIGKDVSPLPEVKRRKILQVEIPVSSKQQYCFL